MSQKKSSKSNGPGISVEQALFQISEYGIETESLDTYYSQLHHIIRQLMYAENFYIALFDQERQLVSFVYFEDEFDDTIDFDELKELDQAYLRRTLTGRLMQTGEMLHLSGDEVVALTESGEIEKAGLTAHDWLGVPLRFKGELLGAIIIQSYLEDVIYSAQDEQILQFVARQIAMVFKSKQFEMTLRQANVILEKRVLERTKELNQINEALELEIKERTKSEQIQASLFLIAELVSSGSSLNEFYIGVHHAITDLMYAENAYIALLSEDGKIIQFPYFCDAHDETPEPREFSELTKDAGLTERVIRFGAPLLINHDASPNSQQGAGAKSISWLGVPLKDKENTFGILAVQSYNPAFRYGEKDKTVLHTIGQQVATAILRKKDADALRQAHESLERRVKERTFELEETIEKRKVIEKKLEHESLHDSLTSLPNRLHLSNRLAEAMNTRNKDPQIAVMFIDLDRFKLINDSLGHHVGDIFLQQVSKRLQKCVRGDDLVARLGGDEFCIVMFEIDDQDGVLHLADRILKALNKPVAVETHSLITSGSIGIRLVRTKKATPDEVMADADAAMYQAKQQGKNRYCLFDADIKEIVSSRMLLENELRNAIDKRQLELHFQPIFDLQSQSISGVEALIRWQHPTQGFISPVQFIPIAEETGLIVPLGEEVIRLACDAMAVILAEKEYSDFSCNINVSAIQILAQTVDQSIREHLLRRNLKPNCLNVEITESILIEDFKSALQFVRELKTIGIKTYLDDFGTGYSSLSYLKKFPFDALKLDRSFIMDVNDSEANGAIVKSISDMAKNLGMRIVAEGIETKEQLQTVTDMGYSSAQGFLLAKPMPLDVLLKWLRSNPAIAQLIE